MAASGAAALAHSASRMALPSSPATTPGARQFWCTKQAWGEPPSSRGRLASRPDRCSYPGKGQTIAVIEDSDLYKSSDWDTFRSTFGLTNYTSGSLNVLLDGMFIGGGARKLQDHVLHGKIAGHSAQVVLGRHFGT
jgi:hypothetical protein